MATVEAVDRLATVAVADKPEAIVEVSKLVVAGILVVVEVVDM